MLTIFIRDGVTLKPAIGYRSREFNAQELPFANVEPPGAECRMCFSPFLAPVAVLSCSVSTYL